MLGFLKSTFRVLLFAYAGILLVLYIRQDAMLFPSPSQRSELPELENLIQVEVITPDKETLPGWYIPPQGAQPVILFFHGNGDQINNFGFLAEQFVADGYGFAAIEYRGYPGSTGAVSEAGLLIDGLAAFDWVKQKCQCNIVAMGHSLGTGVAVYVAAEREALAVALFAPFSSIVDVAASRFWFLPVKWLIKNPFHSDDRIKSVTEPVLMVHGTADTVIPIQFGQRLFSLANQPKEFVAIEGAGHNDVFSESSIQHVLALAKQAGND